jgi:hypothetical protein
MAEGRGSTRKKPVGSMIITGLISIALYFLLLSKQGVINDYISRGGMFAFLPIAVAFIFSLVHGAFTSHFWTVLGIEAARRKREVK